MTKHSEVNIRNNFETCNNEKDQSLLKSTVKQNIQSIL